MFTGIIQEVGTVEKVEKGQKATIFNVSAAKTIKGKKIGDSIAINGVCVTVTSMSDSGFTFDAISETLKLSNFKSLKIGSKINIEPSLILSQSIDGHLVQGHVDGEGEVLKCGSTLSIKFPKEIAKFLALKGSVTINGVSLTISDLHDDDQFSVELIPHTIENTNFKYLKKGDSVNLEVDLIARYLHRMLKTKDNETTHETRK